MRFRFPQGREAFCNCSWEVSLDILAASFPQPPSNELGEFDVFLSLHLLLPAEC